MQAGFSAGTIRSHLNAGRWRTVARRGVYATFSGPLGRDAQLWRAVLACGDDATLSHYTAAELHGLVDGRERMVHVTVPGNRRVVPPVGIVIHHSARLTAARHPSLLPPRTRVEETVVDLSDLASTVDDAIALMSAAVNRRLTTVPRLRDALAARNRSRWRRQLAEALGDIESGCHSLLEIRYLHDVERAHRLPRGERQAAASHRGRTIYRDVHYEGRGVVVELDGVVAHPPERRGHDLDRDNAAAIRGDVVLHYGWSSVTRRACAVAAEVASALATQGWRGRPRKCSPSCMIR